METIKKLSIRDMTIVAVFTALIAIGAFIRIPIPYVPFTLQLLFTMLAGLLLGAKLGMVSVLTYIILGLVGVPIFTEGGGPSYVLKPSFGYIIGFAIGSYLTGKIANEVDEPSLKRLLVANFLGLAVVYACGMIHYYLVSKYIILSPISLKNLFIYCFLLAVPGDVFLCVSTAFLARRLIPILKR